MLPDFKIYLKAVLIKSADMGQSRLIERKSTPQQQTLSTIKYRIE